MDLAPGMVIGDRYRLEAEIGHGGTSHVYRATELRLEREVALKLLSKDSVDSAGAQRFRREAELARKLEHPNTVRLLDFDLEAKPLPFIAYELLSGESLDRLIRSGGAMSEERTARLATQVLKSLLEAHRSGIVHRDVKPPNVFVCTYAGEADFVKVLDFGIAKSTEVSPDVALTAAGMLVGTPRYMPPEQIRGTAPAPSMDLYAVGMMMAEMLLGSPVLRMTPVEACLEQLKTERIELPPAVARSKLGSIIEKATEKDLKARYADAAEMLADIERTRPGLSSDVGSGFTAPDEELPSSQVATRFMADPTADAPPVSGLGDTVFAPLEERAPVPPRGATGSGAPPPAKAAARAGSGNTIWIVAAVVAVLAAMGATALLVVELQKSVGAGSGAPAPTAEAGAPAARTSAAPAIGVTGQAAAEPSTVTLSISSEPSGAKVLRAGVVVCESSPCDLAVNENEAVVLQAERGELRGEARVLAQRSQRVRIELVKPAE